MTGLEKIIRDDVSSKAVMIYRYLLYRQGKNTCCYPSLKRIAADNKCSVSTVKRAVGELIAKGYITKTPRRKSDGSRSSNCYVCLK